MEIINGEIVPYRDKEKQWRYITAFLLALAAIVLLLLISQTSRFEEGSLITREGTVTDVGMTGIPMVPGNPFYEPADAREYIIIDNGDGETAVFSASPKASDRRKYSLPKGISPGDRVKITAAKEIGTGLMVVQETIYYIENQKTAAP